MSETYEDARNGVTYRIIGKLDVGDTGWETYVGRSHAFQRDIILHFRKGPDGPRYETMVLDRYRAHEPARRGGGRVPVSPAIWAAEYAEGKARDLDPSGEPSDI